MLPHRLLLAALFFSNQASEPARQSPLPQGPGLAAQYPGDEGIAACADVLLHESFEEGAVADLTSRWESVEKLEGGILQFVDDAPAGASGRRSLKITGTPTRNPGGNLYRRLPREVDQLFLRFYVKFPEPANYVHHFVHIGGYHPSTAWPQGGAGSRPAGNDRVTVGIEPFGRDGRVPAPGDWNFYAYWHEMKISADKRYWGNALTPRIRQEVPVGRWQCVEVMLKLNKPGESDGELALWLDGKLIMHIKKGTPRGPWTGMGFEVKDSGGEPFEGFNFRTTDDLKLNFVWLLLYLSETNSQRNGVPSERPTVVQFDNVVAATSYIGPIAPKR